MFLYTFIPISFAASCIFIHTARDGWESSIHINSPLDSMIQKELRQIDKNLKSSV